jgi:predicted  nucleic acid-binding Zn-ribbon protein
MLKELFELQKTDSRIDYLNRQIESLPEKKESAGFLLQINTLKEKKKEASTKLKSLTLEQDKIEGELQMLESKIKRETDKLYSGKVVNPKELSGLQAELKQLSEKKDSIENNILIKMDEVAKIQEVDDFYNKKINELDKKLNAALDVVEGKTKEISEELRSLEITRQAQAEVVDEELLEEYEDLRKKNHGIAVAELTDGACQACHMELPEVELDKMKPEEKNYCPFCERLIRY